MQGLSVRVFLGALELLMQAWGLGMPLAGRRQLGDRGESIPHCNSYTIRYEFRLPDGHIAQGNTTRVGDYFSPRHLTEGSPVQVHYVPGFPSLSEVQWHWATMVKHAIVAAVGGVLLHLAFRERLRPPSPAPQRAGGGAQRHAAGGTIQ